MKRHLTWMMSIVISLAIHLVWFARSPLARPVPPSQPPPELVIAEVLPTPVPKTRPAPPRPDAAAQPLSPTKYQPNLDKQDDRNEPTPPLQNEPEKPKDDTVAEEAAAPKDPAPAARADPVEPVDPARLKQEISQYRRQILQQFEDDWQKVPELSTTITDLSQLPAIDRHFGITILAYGFVDHKPSPPFLVLNSDGENFEKVEAFDFSLFSNRIKDRMLYPKLRLKLDDARAQNNIGSFLKIIGLVPADTDRYFAGKQLRAVQLSGLPLEKVAATTGHYEPDGAGGFSLIIDAVRTVDGRHTPIRDEEMKYTQLTHN